MSTVDSPSRPRPIVIAQVILTIVGSIVTAAGFADQIPAGAAWWVLTGYGALNLGLAFYLQSIVTPVSSPKDADGTDLVRADSEAS